MFNRPGPQQQYPGSSDRATEQGSSPIDGLQQCNGPQRVVNRSETEEDNETSKACYWYDRGCRMAR
jgi:hypothetical protein